MKKTKFILIFLFFLFVASLSLVSSKNVFSFMQDLNSDKNFNIIVRDVASPEEIEIAREFKSDFLIPEIKNESEILKENPNQSRIITISVADLSSKLEYSESLENDALILYDSKKDSLFIYGKNETYLEEAIEILNNYTDYESNLSRYAVFIENNSIYKIPITATREIQVISPANYMVNLNIDVFEDLNSLFISEVIIGKATLKNFNPGIMDLGNSFNQGILVWSKNNVPAGSYNYSYEIFSLGQISFSGRSALKIGNIFTGLKISGEGSQYNSYSLKNKKFSIINILLNYLFNNKNTDTNYLLENIVRWVLE